MFRYRLSCLLIGLLCIFMGTQLFQTGHALHGPSVHAYRKWLYPTLPNKLSIGITFDELAQYLT